MAASPQHFNLTHHRFGVDSATLLYGTNGDLPHLMAPKGIHMNEGTSNILFLTGCSNLCVLFVHFIVRQNMRKSGISKCGITQNC